MSRSRIRNTADAFIKSYQPKEDITPAERCAEFLNEMADRYPLDFVHKSRLAKIAFNLPNTPTVNNSIWSRFSYMIGKANVILGERHKRCIIGDRVEGYRATHDDGDLAANKLRRETNRFRLAHQRVQKTSEMINVRNLHGPLKDEVLKTREAFARIGSSLSTIPLLQLPAKSEK